MSASRRKQMTSDRKQQRQKLFLEVLPKWESRIKSVSFQTITAKPLPSYLDSEDVANRLRLAIWHAVTSWDEEKGMALDSWIFHCIQQGRSLMVEEFYGKIPRTSEGNRIPISSIDSMVTVEGDEEVEAQLVDMLAQEQITEFVERESFDEVMVKIRTILPNEFHQKVFDMILSGEYDSDQDIADTLEVDFARIGDVRFRMKIAFAVMSDIPISTFTTAQNAARMASEMKRKLASL
jgi:hypothetical protein